MATVQEHREAKKLAKLANDHASTDVSFSKTANIKAYRNRFGGYSARTAQAEMTVNGLPCLFDVFGNRDKNGKIDFTASMPKGVKPPQDQKNMILATVNTAFFAWPVAVYAMREAVKALRNPETESIAVNPTCKINWDDSMDPSTPRHVKKPKDTAVEQTAEPIVEATTLEA